MNVKKDLCMNYDDKVNNQQMVVSLIRVFLCFVARQALALLDLAVSDGTST